jgi:HTH-type transcriptional regulator/antitoxin HigA
MAIEVEAIRNEADHDAALAEIERLWGSARGTPEGARLDALATLVDAYEERAYPMDPPPLIDERRLCRPE